MPLFDFEDLLFPAEFKNADNYAWVNTGDDAFNGARCLKSGNFQVDRSESSFYIIGDFYDGWFSCRYRVSSESGWDYAYIYVDGVPFVNGISGEGVWQTLAGIHLTPGIHVIQFSYVKDNSSSSGDDCFYIDNISLPNFTDKSSEAEYFGSPLSSNWTNDPVLPWETHNLAGWPFNGLKSGTTATGQTSTLIYNSDANSPAGVVYFLGMADSSTADPLRFLIDGVEVYSDDGQAFSSPTRGPAGYVGSVSAGTHEYRWIFTRTATGNAYNAGFLHSFHEPGMSPVSSVIEASGTVLSASAASSGASSVFCMSSGGVDALSPEALGTATVLSVIVANGAVVANPAHVSGQAQMIIQAIADVATGASSADGVSVLLAVADGDAYAGAPVADGSGAIIGVVTASGSVMSSSATAICSADVVVIADGDVASEVATALGSDFIEIDSGVRIFYKKTESSIYMVGIQ